MSLTTDDETHFTMTTRYTHKEWLAIIDQATENLPISPAIYKAPNVGSEDFAKAIDHTLLKLDATKEQMDTLCEEARRFNFKVISITSLPFYPDSKLSDTIKRA